MILFKNSLITTIKLIVVVSYSKEQKSTHLLIPTCRVFFIILKKSIENYFKLRYLPRNRFTLHQPLFDKLAIKNILNSFYEEVKKWINRQKKCFLIRLISQYFYRSYFYFIGLSLIKV